MTNNDNDNDNDDDDDFVNIHLFSAFNLASKFAVERKNKTKQTKSHFISNKVEHMES